MNLLINSNASTFVKKVLRGFYLPSRKLIARSNRRCSIPMNFLKNSENSQENICTGVSSFSKFTNWRPAILYTKESPEQMFFCECCKVFKNTYFEEKMLLYRSSYCSHQKYSKKKLFLKISQYSQETQVFSCENYKVFRSN